MGKIGCLVACLVSVVLPAFASGSNSIGLEELDLSNMTCGAGQPRKNLSIMGKPLNIGGEEFQHGVGTHANSSCFIALDGKAVRFTASVGLDSNTPRLPGSIEFIVAGDGAELWRSGVCRADQKPRQCTVDLAGIKELDLEVTDADDGNGSDHADWGNAVIEYDGALPRTFKFSMPREDPYILTPPPPATPRINGPEIYGVHPGHPFILRIPATGDRPMTFEAKNLPSGLRLDGNTGIVTGSVADKGVYSVTLTAKNKAGSVDRAVRIAVGDQLALTPPMGWNPAYILCDQSSDQGMRFAADKLISSGMADFGYQYVNIDDCWARRINSTDPVIGGPTRDAEGRILCNSRFPDMKALTKYIHDKGLRAGIYSSPGPFTCGQCEGSAGHEAQDLQTFVDWGFDFLKYDQCSYQVKEPTPAEFEKPYKVMWDLIQKANRDVVENLCQYGNGQVWKWGGDVGNSWRTTPDMGMQARNRLPAFYAIGIGTARLWQYAKPGAWNDPDYLLVGVTPFAQSDLTPSERYSYMSMWCLMDAPLIFSCDMGKLDAFTLNVLCNSEVIGVNQDSLGKQASIAKFTYSDFVLVKEMADHSKAAGVFNLSAERRDMTVSWKELGVSGRQMVRDLWRQKDVGTFDKSFTMSVPAHGVSVIRLAQSD